MLRCGNDPITSGLPEAFLMTNSLTMNIDEAKAFKAALAKDIEKLLVQFTDATGTTVESVYVDHQASMGPRSLYIVSVEVRL